MARRPVKSSTSGIQLQTQVTGARRIEKQQQRPLRRSARLAGARDQTFPSPSTSNALNQKAQQHSPSPIKVSHPPQTSEANRKPERKRKRSQEDHGSASHTQDEPAEKQARPSSPDRTTGNEVATRALDDDGVHPIEHWAITATWPERFFQKDFKMKPLQPKRKRSLSTMSYSLGVKEGINPLAHSSDFEQRILERAGIFLGEQIGGATIEPDAQELCNSLLEATYETPTNTLFEGDVFWHVMNGVRNEGEGRIVRDLQPNIIPSAEILSFRGLLKHNYLREKISAPWDKINSLAGPIPCPDLMVGFHSSAFTDPEIDMLIHHHTPNTPSRFTGDVYFPFFTGEAKGGANGLNESDCQNARSAATAINAILELYRRGEGARQESEATLGIDQLHREVIYFSISHDHEIVKIYSHYVLINDNKTTFHRHLLRVISLVADNGENRWLAYNFIRKLYDHFAPIHLKRIRDAIPYLRQPKSESFISQKTNHNCFQEMPPPSQYTIGTKKTRLTAPSVLQNQIDRMNKEIERKNEEIERLRRESEQKVEQQTQQLNSLTTLLQQELDWQRQKNQGLKEEISKLTQSVLSLAAQKP